MRLEFGAPWSRALKTASLVSVALLVLIAVVGTFILPAQLWAPRVLIIALPVAVLAIAFVNIVSGYALSASDLEVRRPLWSNSFPLTELLAVNGDPQAFKGALRLFGNGGLFSFTGYFWTRNLGFYRAFATDPARAVVLKFGKRTIVITPDDPLHFIVRARTLLTNRHPTEESHPVSAR